MELVVFIGYFEFRVLEIAVSAVTVRQPFEAIGYHGGIGRIAYMVGDGSVGLEPGLYIFVGYNIIFGHPAAEVRYNAVRAPTR